MQPTQHTYPVFEANQVLTNAHLNQIFNYLDEQGRLTRANLIGIGIVCGLEISLDAATTTIHLAKGCGVTSEGYLIIEPKDLSLISYRPYTLPTGLEYLPFKDKAPGATPPYYPLWELFEAGENQVTLLSADPTFLDNKAVLLFLELRKDGLRNCSPNNCDDKGTEVTATVRRLLIELDELNKIIAEANKLATNLSAADLEATLSARLNLPDLRLPRYDVPNTSPATSTKVLNAFLRAFSLQNAGLKLAAATHQALTKAYEAFEPLLHDAYASNPFGNFLATFGFLDSAPTTTAQLRFLPYYYGFFDDLLRAYDEFRWKGLDLLCACCPSEELFPRHLMMGALVAAPGSSIYRHGFLASSAISGCEERTKELVQLFRRLVEMTNRFTNNPPLPTPSTATGTDAQIRITPSKLADVPLSEKAIPYYYQQTGTPPLFQLWNAEKTRRNRANQNLGYRSDEYTPTAPAFVLNALNYDLEPYNFLRIEGHLGKNYQNVLSTLLLLKAKHRLPIEVLALSTGVFDENMPVDLSKEECRFADLEALYDAFREELMRTLCEGVMYLYDVPMPATVSGNAGGTPQLPLLINYAPNYRPTANTVGAWYEANLALLQAKPYIDVDQHNVNPIAVLTVYCTLFAGTSSTPPAGLYAHIVSVYYLSKLSERMPASLSDLAYPDFENKYQDLVGLTRYFQKDVKSNIAPQFVDFIPQEELIDHFDQVLFGCKMEAFRSIHEEYVRRIREVKKKQFLSYFLQSNPGIQHKAGVPLGGTFILVYHGENQGKAGSPPVLGNFTINGRVFIGQIQPIVGVTIQVLGANQGTVTNIGGNFSLQLTKLPTTLRFSFPGFYSVDRVVTDDDFLLVDMFDGSIAAPQEGIANFVPGQVIADFYLPYICCSDCSPVQFVLPKPRPTFTLQIGCTDAEGGAEVTIVPQGGIEPYSFKVDTADYQALATGLVLSAGSHTITVRDAEGTESAPQILTIAETLSFGESSFDCIGEGNEYVATFSIFGGIPPYTASRGTVNGANYVSDPLPGDTDIEITITDSRQCTAVQTLRHSCLPPLAFTMQVGCTTANNQAPVTILPSGGTPPYEVQIGTTPFAPINGAIFLSAGTHTLAVRDANGTQTAPQALAIPNQFTISPETYTENPTANTYQVAFGISGGTPPYSANVGTVSGILFTSDPVPSGQGITVEMTDSVGCKIAKEFTHTIENPCDLPCGGAALRSGYRFWLPVPDPNRPYNSYGAEVPEFSFEFPQGGSVDLAQEVNDSIHADANDLQTNFEGVVQAWLKEINARIASKIGTDDWLKLDYAQVPEEPFGTLFIEYFACLQFRFNIHSFFRRLEQSENSNNVYTPEGTTIIDPTGAEPIRIPAFNTSEINKCQRDSRWVARCTETAINLKIGQKVGNNSVELSATATGKDKPVAFLWEVEDGIPATSNKQKAGFGFTKTEPIRKKVRLTAFTEKGCSVTVEDIIIIGKP